MFRNIFSQFISYNVTYSTSDCHFSGSMCDFKETDCHVSRIANLWKQHYAIISFSYPRHQRFNEFILLFIFVNVSLRLLNVSPVILFPLFEFLYIRSEIIETITLTSLEKRPIIEISTKNLQLSWNFEVYDIILFISGKLLNLSTSIDQYLCTNVNRQSLIRRPASAQSPSSKANTVHIRLVRNIYVNSWDCCYRWDSSHKFRTLHQLAFPSLESHFAGP